MTQVYCEICGIYVTVRHGDDLLLCPNCSCPLMFHPVMDIGEKE